MQTAKKTSKGKRRKFIALNEGFVCGNCGREVGPIEFGGSYRNHCPYCLYSKHVDSDVPGDRAGDCGGLMRSIGILTRRTGEYVLVHQCEKCNFVRYNRIAGDDDFRLITDLSTNPVRSEK